MVSKNYYTYKLKKEKKKKLKIQQIADEIICSERNTKSGQLCIDNSMPKNNTILEDIEIDYHGYDVNLENIRSVLLGIHKEGIADNRYMKSSIKSNVFLYIAGHSAVGFTKIRNRDILTSQELSDIINEMRMLGRFNKLFILLDTCHGESMFEYFNTDNVIIGTSSKVDEDSYSYGYNADYDQSIMDRFTNQLREIYIDKKVTELTTIKQFSKLFPKTKLNSTPVFRAYNYIDLNTTYVNEFLKYSQYEASILPTWEVRVYQIESKKYNVLNRSKELNILIGDVYQPIQLNNDIYKSVISIYKSFSFIIFIGSIFMAVLLLFDFHIYS